MRIWFTITWSNPKHVQLAIYNGSFICINAAQLDSCEHCSAGEHAFKIHTHVPFAHRILLLLVASHNGFGEIMLNTWNNNISLSRPRLGSYLAKLKGLLFSSFLSMTIKCHHWSKKLKVNVMPKLYSSLAIRQLPAWSPAQSCTCCFSVTSIYPGIRAIQVRIGQPQLPRHTCMYIQANVKWSIRVNQWHLLIFSCILATIV